MAVALPVVALTTVGVQQITSSRSEAEASRAVAAEAELQQAVAEVVAPAKLEQIALEGLAHIDALGVERDIVVEFADIDLEAIYFPNKMELDRALLHLVDNYGSLFLGDEHTFGDHIDEFRDDLGGLRELSEERRAPQTEIRELFDHLDKIVTEALAAPELTTGRGAPNAVDERMRLRSLADVTTSAGHRGTALLDSLVDPSPRASTDFVGADAHLEAMSEVHARHLSPEQLARFESTELQLQPISTEFLTIDITDTDAGPFIDPSFVILVTAALLEQTDYLDALSEYSSESSADVVSTLEQGAESAEAEAERTAIGIALILLVTIALVVAIGTWTLRPLRRLASRARLVSDGEIDADALALVGPRDIRVLTDSMNQMLGTLSTVEEQISSLAEGTASSSLSAPPGSIGVSLRRSFDRLHDVTSKLQESEELSTAIVEQAGDAIWTIDTQGIVRSANEASRRLLDITTDEQIGRPLDEFLTSIDGDAAVVGHEDNSVRLLVTNSVIDGERGLTAVIAHDLTERVRFEQRLAYQASHDSLTELPNRFSLLDQLSTLRHDTSLSVIFIDLDGFKQVNDVQGHLVGDRVLAEVAGRLQANKYPDDFASRLGGDEFIILTDQCDPADVAAYGRDLIAAIELPPYGDPSTSFSLSASVGVACYPEGLKAADLSSLDAIRQADSAVYRAKERGRGCVEIFDLELQEALIRHGELEIALRSAVDNGELELHFQPVMDLATGIFTSAEALVRWTRPGTGPVSPADFIPIAEKSSLILSLDRWVMRQACTTLARWRQIDPQSATRIAINVSGRHLMDGDLLGDLDRTVAETGADPSLLEIELTETLLLEDLDRTTSILESVRARGITVAIDDFGTGYSSMAYLQKLPIDTLKIDRSFISAMSDASSFDSSVIDALISIGSSLGTSVVAEGIETVEQLEFVTTHGCQRGQGFLMARPMPAADAERLIRVTAEDRLAELSSTASH